MATAAQKKALKKAHKVRKCLVKKYGKKSAKTGKKVFKRKATLKQKAACGSQSAKAKLKR